MVLLVEAGLASELFHLDAAKFLQKHQDNIRIKALKTMLNEINLNLKPTLTSLLHLNRIFGQKNFFLRKCILGCFRRNVKSKTRAFIKMAELKTSKQL